MAARLAQLEGGGAEAEARLSAGESGARWPRTASCASLSPPTMPAIFSRTSSSAGSESKDTKSATSARTVPKASIIRNSARASQRPSPPGEAERGIAVCGSGIGISIAVNRNPACRCARVDDPLSAELAREHNDANVLALGGRLIGTDMAKACVSAFLGTGFAGGRHQRRVDQLSNELQESD